MSDLGLYHRCQTLKSICDALEGENKRLVAVNALAVQEHNKSELVLHASLVEAERKYKRLVNKLKRMLGAP